MQYHKPRMRKVRILATLGPASDTPEMIEKLFRAGADAFRVNMSHGEQADKAQLIANIRALEKAYNRPTTILVDLQGPKLRVGTFGSGKVELKTGEAFRLDTNKKAGDASRVYLPHPEIFAALEIGARLLLDDGKLVLRVMEIGPDHISTQVEVGGMLSDRKGLNVPDVVVPIAALTDKDRSDLAFALDQGVDARFRVEAAGHVAHHVLDELGVVVGALGDELFVRPLEQAVELAGGLAFDQLALPAPPAELPSMNVRRNTMVPLKFASAPPPLLAELSTRTRSKGMMTSSLSRTLGSLWTSRTE